ncbi:zinc finger protein ZFP2-like [Phlebotomus papatasi]|uniref:zinc finger protein ZFP2-like n=1 Tax=Phlebotomus papatasi TaxID=29031 RepID=UPI002484072B|nr:zinc finger protein ZFP2-like [Phlebotomus papatasi]
MGSLENPLIQCNTIRDLLNRLNRIYNELIDHENTLPKCEICWLNHAEFSSLKAQLILIVQDNATGKEEEHPAFEYVQLESGPEIQPFSSVIMKEEPEFVLLNNQCCPSDIESDDLIEGTMEKSDLLEETDVLSDIKRKKEKTTCRFCFKNFYNEGSLKEHMTNHAKRGLFNCCTCGTSFESLDEFTTHQENHKKNKDLGLGSSAMSAIKVKPRAQSKIQKSQFDCVFCDMEFSKKRQIVSHLRVHIKPENANLRKEPLKDRTCNICNRSFNTSRGLKKHLAIKGKKGECPNNIKKSMYSCKFCNKSYHNSFTLDKHLEYREAANINCDTCNEKFCLHSDLQNHQKTVHNMNISLKCQFCKEQFLNYRLIYRHHRKNHPQESMPRSPHLCESCGLSMMNASDLSLHVIKYHNSSKLTCKVCNKGFAKEAELEEHRRIHIPISQLQDLYECDLCPKKFRMKLTFLKHKRLHTTNKITEMFCEVCGKRFINIEKLQKHQEKHAEEGTRDFKCDICGHQFKKLKYLNQHRKMYHNIYTQMMLNPKPRKK